MPNYAKAGVLGVGGVGEVVAIMEASIWFFCRSCDLTGAASDL